MNDYSDPDPEIVLRAVKQSRRVVVDLKNPNIDPVARTNIESASKRGGNLYLHKENCHKENEVMFCWPNAGRV